MEQKEQTPHHCRGQETPTKGQRARITENLWINTDDCYRVLQECNITVRYGYNVDQSWETPLIYV